MDIKEAHRIIRGEVVTATTLDRYKAVMLVQDAIKDGYTLCKVDDIAENADEKIHEYCDKVGGCSIATMHDIYAICIHEACDYKGGL